MHLQQPKRGSLNTGGPQYWFQGITDVIKIYLENKGAIRVALVTPYGATKSDYYAISKDRKFDKHGNLLPANADHDRIQKGRASESIGESIRKWYNLPNSHFERIDVDAVIIEDILYLTPLRYKFANSRKENELTKIERPLTFTKEYQSQFWIKQITNVDRNLVIWSLAEICRIVRDNKPGTKVAHIQETDILRASGPLKHLGVALGAYVGKGYDCYTEFTFLDYPTYTVPVEIKRHSKNFSYQQKKYGKDELSRAVILCAVHDLKNVRPNIDVIELDSLCQHLEHL